MAEGRVRDAIGIARRIAVEAVREEAGHDQGWRLLGPMPVTPMPTLPPALAPRTVPAPAAEPVLVAFPIPWTPAPVREQPFPEPELPFGMAPPSDGELWEWGTDNGDDE